LTVSKHSTENDIIVAVSLAGLYLTVSGLEVGGVVNGGVIDDAATLVATRTPQEAAEMI
jgi:hypothetical protein